MLWLSQSLDRLFPRRSAATGASGAAESTPTLPSTSADEGGSAPPAGTSPAADLTSATLRFADGDGTLKSNTEARKWFQQAAHQGDAGAQFSLGNLCHPASLSHLPGGAGEARIEAYMWFQLAADQGHSKAAAACETLNLQMTDAELQEGNRRASAFRPDRQKETARHHS